VLGIGAGLSYGAINSTGLFKPKPNIIVILTDDLDLTVMPYMKNTDELIAKQGATFTNFFVTSSLCCPSRASIFRGQYPHNTNILENSPGFMNYFRNGREAETIATWLNNAGYQTSLIGKYLNGYPVGAGKNYVPPGWADWHVFMNQYDSEFGAHYYYDYMLNENGKLVDYGETPEEYSTDVFSDRSIQFINKSLTADSPFFLMLALKAPHGPSIPAPRHMDMFPELTYPEKPSFNEKDISDKPSVIHATTTPGDDFDQYDANALFRKRVETLQAVDEMVAKLIQLLEQRGQLDNTYIIFTSDNGFHMGEHGLPAGKGYSYEEDIHVPFIVRGPGIQRGTQITQMSANIDIAPTIAEMAHKKTADFIDGRSLMPFLHPKAGAELPWRKGLLMETGYLGRNTYPLVYRGVRTETFIYLEYEDGELEYYDLIADPYELNNIAQSLDSTVLTSLHTWVEQLKNCHAEGCRTAEMALPNNLK
jgi:arylsulfatase A-like enzyme